MTRLSILTLGMTLFFAAAATVVAEEAPFQKQLDELLPKLGAEKIPERHGGQRALLQYCLELGAPGKEQQRAEACKLITAKLGGELPTPTRVWLLKLLEYIGRAECIDTVAGLLSDKDALVRDAARRALANNPEKEAGVKLLGEMQHATDAKFKAALINSLGHRGDAASVDALSVELANKNRAVAIAAARALGKIATPDCAKALAAAREKASGELAMRIGDSWLLCADHYAQQGKSAEAAAIYRKLSQSTENRALRLAAVQGLLKVTSRKKEE